MAGQLTIDTLKASSGVLATQNGMTGIAKAWVQLTGSGTTPTINGSFNISSITRNGAGEYVFNFTTAMPNANYSAISNSSINTAGTNFTKVIAFGKLAAPYYVAPTTSSFYMYFVNAADAGTEPLYGCVAVFSS